MANKVWVQCISGLVGYGCVLPHNNISSVPPCFDGWLLHFLFAALLFIDCLSCFSFHFTLDCKSMVGSCTGGLVGSCHPSLLAMQHQLFPPSFEGWLLCFLLLHFLYIMK